VTEHLYFIIDAYVKPKENPEHQYWPDQSRTKREKNLYWTTMSGIDRVVLSVSQRHFHLFM
jgi:hypothetical protein